MKNREGQQSRLERIIKTQALIAQADLHLDVFMQLVVGTVQELTQAKGAAIELVDGEYMFYRSASGAIAQYVGLRLLRANSLSGLCVSSTQVLNCSDAESDPRVDINACRKIGVRSMICTPLFENGVPVGVLKVMSAIPSAFNDEDIQTLSLMSGALGAALGKQVAFDAMVQMQAKLSASEQRMRTILEHANDAVISTDRDGILTQWNRAAECLFGWTGDEAIGRNLVDLIIPADKRNSFNEILQTFYINAQDTSKIRRELLVVDRQGKKLHVEVSLNVNDIGGRLEFTAFLHDISQRKILEGTLREMALSDGLTGLPNRRHFMDTLEQALARHRRQQHGLALLFMDLNGFKQINDNHGHEVGDKVLKEFANRVCSCLRETDTVARLGGDEFVVLAEGIQVLEQAELLTQKIVITLDLPLPGSAILIDTSIGISLYKSQSDAAQFLKGADLAMYYAKKIDRRIAGASPLWNKI
ncbi:diguanylate cyclase (GGDEF)-like protein/PAS domain S-box-containing protein [Undibacterium sp. GrIS 1.2]|uniref:diguanylate cyclase domain-containing protein n=1 Tax=Undibacterium sp. GrIS 1.2 TaxID=3143933 RepID=UPI0033955DCD